MRARDLKRMLPRRVSFDKAVRSRWRLRRTRRISLGVESYGTVRTWSVQPPERVRKGEDDVGVPDRQQLAFALGEPLIARVRKCQAQARERWLHARARDLLDVPYVQVALTLRTRSCRWPIDTAPVCTRGSSRRGHRRPAPPRRRDWRAEHPRYVAATLVRHPHVRCVVPAGGLSPDHDRWIPSTPRPSYGVSIAHEHLLRSEPASSTTCSPTSRERCASTRRSNTAQRHSLAHASRAGWAPPSLARRRRLDPHRSTLGDPDSSSRAGRQRLPSSLVIEGVSACASGCSCNLERRDTSDERSRLFRRPCFSRGACNTCAEGVYSRWRIGASPTSAGRTASTPNRSSLQS